MYFNRLILNVVWHGSFAYDAGSASDNDVSFDGLVVEDFAMIQELMISTTVLTPLPNRRTQVDTLYYFSLILFELGVNIVLFFLRTVTCDLLWFIIATVVLLYYLEFSCGLRILHVLAM